MRTRLSARWIVGHAAGHHTLVENGCIVFEDDSVLFVGHDFPGEVDITHDYGTALIAPGFIDLDALSDLDTTILGFDNQPAHEKGRVWPQDYIPYEMYTPEELAFQKHYAFAQLLRQGITTALPIASLFYREWGETTAEFSSAAASAADLGLRVSLGPAYRTGNSFIDDAGAIDFVFDEPRGLAGLEEAITFARAHDNTHHGLVRAMLAPDRIEGCTEALLRRSADAARELGIPIRLHCCQSKFEVDSIMQRHGMTPPEWLENLGFLSHRALLPHGNWVSGRDLDIIGAAGATIVHCPLVSARGGRALNSFARIRKMGVNIGMGTDTWPPDMLQNLQTGLITCRIAEGTATSVRAADYFDAATTGGADALHRPDLGRLMPGAKADITVFNFNHDRIGQIIDPIQTLLIGGSSRDISNVFVNGRHVVVNGAIPGFDFAAAHARAQAQFDGLVARYPERTWKHPPVSEIFSTSYPPG